MSLGRFSPEPVHIMKSLQWRLIFISLSGLRKSGWSLHQERLTAQESKPGAYYKSRLSRTHYEIFVRWGPPTFHIHEIFVQSMIFNANETIALHSYAWNFRRKPAVYEMYENKRPTKYSGFTVLHQEKDTSVLLCCNSEFHPQSHHQMKKGLFIWWWLYQGSKNPSA